MPYSYVISDKDEKNVARAYGREVNVSPKNTNEVCAAIRGMMTKKALEYLENVQAKKDFVPLKKYFKKVPHRKGGVPGRYPKKAAKRVEEVLKNAIANAEHKGLDADRLKIIHAAANKGFTLERVRPKGRGGHGIIHQGVMHNIDLTNIQIIVRKT